MHRVTRLSGNFKGNLDRDAVERTVSVIAQFVAEAKKVGVDEIRAACTGVMRKAGDAGLFLEKVQSVCGILPRIISGECEAQLTTLGAVIDTGFSDVPFVLFDIGGFSTEIVLVNEGRSVELISTDLGVVHLKESYIHNEIPTKRQIETIHAIIDDVISRQAEVARAAGFISEHLVGTAGTATTLAAMAQNLKEYDPEKVEGYLVGHNRLREIFEELKTTNGPGRIEQYPALEKGREDVIIPGILICLAMMERFGHSLMKVTEGGLLEGLVYAETF